MAKILLVAALAAAIWWWWSGLRRSRTMVPPAEARRLLGVSDTATLAEIREAHRRLIAKVHPDAGGSAELATRVNAARDSLIAELNRRTPRAS